MWYGGCFYSRDREKGTITNFADELVKNFCVDSVQNGPIKAGVKLEDFKRLKIGRFVN